MKKLICLILALILCLSLFTGVASAAGFPFADVPIYEWYFNDVKNAYDMSLINGKTGTHFAPNDYLTYAEAVKLAACMNERYLTGAVTLQNGSPWYQSYVDYCKQQGIIKKDYNWNVPATRAGYMEIFANALPDGALSGINDVPDASVPDVPMTHPQAKAIYSLYRAGILQGNDAAHNCSPAANIKRSEVAAILTRMMDASKRIHFSMGTAEVVPDTEQPEEEAVEKLKIKEQPVSVSGKSGDEVMLEIWIEGGKLPYTYTWLCGNEFSAGIINDRDGTWVAGGSRSGSGSFFSKLYITLPADDEVIGDKIFCVIEDSAGQKVTSNMVTVTMEKDAAPLKITSSPKDVTVLPGESAELSVSVSGGTAPYKYRWEQYSSSAGIWSDTGVSSDTMVVRVPPAHAGGRQTFRCVITDASGCSITSDTAAVIVEAAAALEVSSASDVAGSLVNLYVYADEGTAPYTFTWQGWDSKYGPTTYVKNWDGITIADAKTSSSLTVNTTKCSCTRYLCTVTDASGTSKTVEFTIK